MIDKTKPIAALFDLDGVVIDTESQYSVIWKQICKEYLGDESIAEKVKGNTLVHIYEEFFYGIKEKLPEITKKLRAFEAEIKMEYIPGIKDFLAELRAAGIKTAVVTSSSSDKMKNVFRNHPEFPALFDTILTAEMFAKSKPAPDPYLLGAHVFKTVKENCFVFEDSFNGLRSGRAAEMTVVGLATTNPADAIAPYADAVIKDFTEMNVEKLMKMKGEENSAR